jgi:hypothetical protein
LKSKCIAQDCSATDPKINIMNISEFPEEIQIKLKNRHLENQSFSQCNYCGTIWADFIDKKLSEKGVVKNSTLIIGTKELESDKMIWDI